MQLKKCKMFVAALLVVAAVTAPSTVFAQTSTVRTVIHGTVTIPNPSVQNWLNGSFAPTVVDPAKCQVELRAISTLESVGPNAMATLGASTISIFVSAATTGSVTVEYQITEYY